MAEIAQAVGLPPGVINVITADRAVSEMLVRHPGVDKISFTGSTVSGRKIAAICGDRIARFTLELGGKSAAVILDDYDLETRSEEHTSELQSLMRISYAVFCLKKKKNTQQTQLRINQETNTRDTTTIHVLNKQ